MLFLLRSCHNIILFVPPKKLKVTIVITTTIITTAATTINIIALWCHLVKFVINWLYDRHKRYKVTEKNEVMVRVSKEYSINDDVLCPGRSSYKDDA